MPMTRRSPYAQITIGVTLGETLGFEPGRNEFDSHRPCQNVLLAEALPPEYAANTMCSRRAGVTTNIV
jgi:hypothetical protein